MDYYNKYYQGYFWLPEKQEKRFIATLFINDIGEAQLMTLNPIIEVDDKIYRASKEKVEVLFGYITSFEKIDNFSIKIYDLWNNKGNSSLGYHFLDSFGYYSKHVFIRRRIDEYVYDEEYSDLMVSSSKFREWIKVTGMEIKHGRTEDYEVINHYKQPKEILLYENEVKKICIFFRANHSYSIDRHQIIKEEPFVNIELNKSADIKSMFKLKQSINRLFSIILDIPFYSSEVDCRTNSKIDYKYLNKDNKSIHRLGIPYEYEEFIKSSDLVFENWELKQEELELFITNFFSVYGQKGVLPEIKFITYCSVLENYHKNRIRRNSSLKNRLIDLFVACSLSDKLNHIENFSEKIKTTRNYHVHLEERHKANSFESKDLFSINAILEFVIRELFLREIELNNSVNIDHPLRKAINKINQIVGES